MSAKTELRAGAVGLLDSIHTLLCACRTLPSHGERYGGCGLLEVSPFGPEPMLGLSADRCGSIKLSMALMNIAPDAHAKTSPSIGDEPSICMTVAEAAPNIIEVHPKKKVPLSIKTNTYMNK
jgi:hypothetical protein